MVPCRSEHSPKSVFTPHAFSLVELLVVIALLAILSVAAMPAISSGLGSITLGGMGQRLMDEIALARQTAIVKNRSVEFRIYQNGEGDLVRTAVVIPAEGSRPEEWQTNGREFTTGVILDEEFTSAWSDSPQTENSTAGPGALRGLSFSAITFLPDGMVQTASPAADLLTLTLRNKNASDADTLPADNFITFVIDPLTGRVRLFQP